MLMINLAGWIGAVLILIAYYLVSAKKIKGNSNTYQTINLIGAMLLIINTYYLKAYPTTFLNIVWALIALITLIKKRVVHE
jgi:hypothetical protein